MAIAEIYNKGGTDKTLILGSKTQVVYPFEAPNWTDIRFGFYLSITDISNDNLITTLGETITGDPMYNYNAYWIGVKTRNASLPGSVDTSFIGWSCLTDFTARGDTKLLTSDSAIGTTNANFWRPANSLSDTRFIGGILDGYLLAGGAKFSDGTQPHFAQANIGGGGGPAGYASLLGIRLTREIANPNYITCSVKQGTSTGVIHYNSAPTLATLQTTMTAYPWTPAVQTVGPVQMTNVPDALYFYWPFTLSRLRIHSVGFVQAR